MPSKLKRHDYLHTMDIQTWVARSVIEKRKANAPKIMLENKTARDSVTSPLSREVISHQQSVAQSLTSDIAKKDLAVKSFKNAVNFSLLFLTFPDLLIVSELPTSENKTITAEQLKLVVSLRLALGYPKSDLLQSTVMVWPLIENDKIDQGERAAIEAVGAQLKKQMEKVRSQHVVIMGATAGRYVLGKPIIFEDTRGQLIADEKICAVVTHSVNELLKIPLLKSSAWQDLQAIRRISK